MTHRSTGDAMAALGSVFGSARGRHRGARPGRPDAGPADVDPTTGATRAPDPQEEVVVTDSAIGGVPTSGTDVAGDDERSSTDGATVEETGSDAVVEGTVLDATVVEGADGTVLEGTVEDAPGAENGTVTADGAPAGETADAAELERVRRELGERTADLQRVSAEYANYRRRVERDRDATVAGAKASVANELLTVLDDLDRANAHGDLTGPLKVVADRLTETLHKVGLEPFGVEGDPFDPSVHEAVAQETSTEVAGPTVTTVMRRGYRFGERVLRPAMVAVTDRDPS